MATAPTPGVGQRAENATAARTSMTLTIRDESHSFAPNNLSLEERMWLRKQTGGLPLEAFWAGELAIGLDSIQVLWCLARRADGEKGLTLAQVAADWPVDLIGDEIDVKIDDGVGENPEA